MNIYLLILNILKGLTAGVMIFSCMIAIYAAMLWIEGKIPREKGKGTRENPFDNIQDAFDACNSGDRVMGGPGRIFWVDNPDAKLEFFELEEENNAC